MPNFDEISQSTAEIILLRVSENGSPPYWNSISRFDFDVCVVIGMSFCICLTKFVVIGQSSADLWYHTEFSRWRPWSRKSSSRFRFSGICLRRIKSICLPNFDEIPQSTDEIKNSSGFGKRSAVIFEFYFQFKCRPRYRHCHDILHLLAKFRSNQTIVGGVMSSCPLFQDGRRQPYWIWSW